MGFSARSVKVEIIGDTDFDGDANAYTDDSAPIVIRFSVSPDHPLVQQLLEEHHRQVAIEVAAGPTGQLNF